ncbi:uncharacterized protein [Physcomitrium patens]|uniref:Uncharacterized protein n=1 Tax=Physcomitrium patens TaxID=3218 RepID=A0A7I4D3F6_PHYPA|nr:uncharacterized protein LOC112279015 [Physcomitrium patens]|eukprot:XP_024368813.1 uncharacterized protein LOC112279015 [Physcomitrella patens]
MCLEMVKNLNLKGLEEVCHVWAHVVESEEAGGEEEAAALLGGQDVQAAVPMNTTRQIFREIGDPFRMEFAFIFKQQGKHATGSEWQNLMVFSLRCIISLHFQSSVEVITQSHLCIY